ncbi:MAG: histidinol-phosphatase HisJ family protein [Chthoniobacterales bacterium]
MPEPLLYESHLHTPLCRHAVGEPEEYAAEAERKNLRGIIVTCHNPIPNGYSAHVRMRPDQFDEYIALVAHARAAWDGRVDVLLGLECDYAPGLEADVAILLKRADFHHVLGSVHTQVKEYRTRYDTGSAFEYQQTYFHHLALAAETGLFDTLSHPDLVKNQAPHEWNLSRIFPDLQRALDRIAATGIAMELNTSGLHKALPEMNPGPEILAEMQKRGIPVVLGADAHQPQRVGADYPLALRMLQSAGYKNVSLFLNRQRQEIPIADALASLERV